MTSWLLDTNVLSELRKPNCDANVRNWVQERPAEKLYISSITFAEIRFGIKKLEDTNRRQKLTHWVESELRPWFRNRVIEIDESVILCRREMVEIGRKRGHTYSQPDLFLAAAADIHQLCLVTRNIADFEGTDIAILNPWKASE